MLSGDIIERRIQMNPELLGFPGDPLPSPSENLSRFLFRGTLSVSLRGCCQSSPGTSQPFVPRLWRVPLAL